MKTGVRGSKKFVCVSMVFALCGVAAADAGAPLRYRWGVGDRWIYERVVRVERADGTFGDRSAREQVQLWCLAREGDGHLVLIDRIIVGEDSRAADVFGALLVVNPRGVSRVLSEFETRVERVAPVLDVLMPMRPALEPGFDWSIEGAVGGLVYRCSRIGADAQRSGYERLDFSVDDPSGWFALGGIEVAGRAWFDLDGGLLSRVESDRQTSGGRRQSVLRLYARENMDERWCARRVLEAKRWRRALRVEDRLIEAIVERPAEIENTLVRIERLWDEWLSNVTVDRDSPIRRLVRARRKRLAADGALFREQAKVASRWLGRVAPPWSLQDVAGETVASETLRDRYTLEVFWSIASQSSMSALASLEDIRDAAGEGRLRIVCLNVDADADAARGAVRKYGGAADVHVFSAWSVRGPAPDERPVFRLLDAAGVVRHVRFGLESSWVESLGAWLD